jgi:putative ABC transport system substrate-binding protein
MHTGSETRAGGWIPRHHRLIIALAKSAGADSRSFLRAFRYWNLFVYAVDLQELFRGTADQIDQIFGGADPGTIPTWQPTKFELLVNLRAPKSIGLTIPSVLLAQAHEVID